MRLERLVIDAGERTLAADFHPKLTVIGGLDRGAREALAGEVIDSLAGARPGIHLELECGGRSLTVFRPSTGRHRVVDTGSVADVTNEFVGADGDIDLFAAVGVDRALARKTIRLTQEDLTTEGGGHEIVSRLAAVDQDDLWDAAMRLQAADDLLERESAAAGTSAHDAALVDAVEKKHAALVEATETYDRIRVLALVIGDVAAILGLTLAMTKGVVGLPFILIALLSAAGAFKYRSNVDNAREAERQVLTEAGADNYSSFHLERVSALLDSDNERRRFMQAVSDHRRASDAWAEVAGDAPLRFALEHEGQIRATADLQRGVGSLQFLSESAPNISHDVTAELAQALLARLEAVRALTGGEESLPLIVDDPFDGLEPSMKPMLLEMLSTSAGNPQVVVLTADEAVTSWARVEAMTGDLAIVEPTIQQAAIA